MKSQEQLIMMEGDDFKAGGSSSFLFRSKYKMSNSIGLPPIGYEHMFVANEQGFVSVAEIELPQFKPQMQPN